MKTVSINVSEAEGSVLDFLVWKIEHGSKNSNKMSDDELLAALNPYYHPSTNWAQGGLIVDRECITLHHYPVFSSVVESLPARWCASVDHVVGGLTYCVEQYGSTALIAAMRAYVKASFCSDTVEVPAELVEVSHG